MLSKCRVLIAEDEALVACDLAYSVQAARGEVVGPFATVADGLVYLANDDVHAAILDVHLADRDVTPIAVLLLERGRPVVFHSASGVPAEIRDRFGELPLCKKPAPPEHVIWHLARAIGRLA